ncbi:MAG: acetoacetate decarboxylase family protein [Anaerolineae bacterium]|nr:acetoacetate decarboxylase family protein [Anaerolineae bacterium]
MPDSAFFDQLTHFPYVGAEGEGCIPAFYREAMSINANFLAPLKAVRALLPSKKLQPLRATPWHAIITIAACSYADTDAGPYDEAFVAVPVTLDKPATPLFGLLRHLAERPMLYIHQMPVTTQAARDGGWLWANYPKFLANIHFEKKDDWITCQLSESDRRILTFSARQIPVKEVDRWHFDALTVRGDRILLSPNTLSPCKLGVSRNPADVQLELGDHPIADKLRDLQLGRMIELQYRPQFQLILMPASESFPGEGAYQAPRIPVHSEAIEQEEAVGFM